MKKASDNKWVKLALELDSMVRDWDRQMEELNSARQGLEMCDRDSHQEQEENERLSERFALRLGCTVEKYTGTAKMRRVLESLCDWLDEGGRLPDASSLMPGSETETFEMAIREAMKI